MNKNLFKIVNYFLLTCILVLLFKVFYPRNYNVPKQQHRASTQYWNLSTGSKIGYTLIKAKGIAKPYPVIYLHGGPGGYFNDLNIKTLSALSDSGYNVYLYDQIGSGESIRLKNINDYTVERHIEDLKAIIKEIHAEKVVLIGQSWGSILAVLFAAGYSNKIEKIIFTSPGPIYPVKNELADTKTPDSIHLINPFFSNAEGNEKANNIRTNAMAFFATRFGKKIATDNEADEFATYWNYELNKSTVCDTSKILKEEAGCGFYAGIMTYKSLINIPDPRSKISNLTIPVLVLKGECDNQKWGFTNEYLQLFPNHKLVIIPNAGHFIYVEQPQLYIKSIQEFLNE